MNLITLPEALALKFTKHNVKGKHTRRHVLLPARTFEKDGQQIDITPDALAQMADNMKSGKLSERRMVSMAHPHGDDLAAAPAVGWLLCKTADVSAYQDTVALYCSIEWLPEMESDIDKGAYGYISPVFTNHWTDPYGEDQGWALLLAGVTNTPHWTDQPGLFEAFTAHCFEGPGTKHSKAWDRIFEALKAKGYDDDKAAAIATAQEKKFSDDMDDTAFQATLDDLVQQPADESATPTKEYGMNESDKKIAELSALLAAKEAEAEKLESEAAAVQQQVKEFSAASQTESDGLKKRIAELEAEKAKMAGASLIQRFVASGHLQEKHLRDKDGKETMLVEMAYKAPAQFEAVVSLLSPVKLPTSPVGGNSSASDETITDEQRIEMSGLNAIKAADEFIASHPGASWKEAYANAKNAVKNGKAME